MRFFRFLYNKYFLATVVFLAWIFFFDSNDFVSQQAQRKELKQTRAHISWLKEEVTKLNKEYNGMQHDPATLERFAREEYKMKRENEDVYVITDSAR